MSFCSNLRAAHPIPSHPSPSSSLPLPASHLTVYYTYYAVLHVVLHVVLCCPLCCPLCCVLSSYTNHLPSPVPLHTPFLLHFISTPQHYHCYHDFPMIFHVRKSLPHIIVTGISEKGEIYYGKRTMNQKLTWHSLFECSFHLWREGQ